MAPPTAETGHVFRDGKTTWTLKHRRWINAQRLADTLAQLALEQMLIPP